MKEIIFNEGEFENVDQISVALFSDKQDPRSNNYERNLIRPEINWILVAAHLVLPIAVAVCAGFAVNTIFTINFTVSLAIGILMWCVYNIATLKHTIIGAIHIYQRFAPDNIRNKCRFEPSCSQYMILSLQKYGLIKGIKKGVNRLKRCNVNDGGYDLP